MKCLSARRILLLSHLSYYKRDCIQIRLQINNITNETMTISFQNQGIIDPMAWKSFGISAKEGTNPIGQFGTGLKYAIAVILRNDGEISIWSGLNEVKFTLETDTFRGKEVRVIAANGVHLSYTDHLGMNWLPWMAFRELYCNAIDEGGEVGPLDDLFPAEGMTTVVVDCEEIEMAYEDRDQIVIPSHRTPIFENSKLAVYSGPSRYLYYRGVRAGESERLCRFTYSMKQATITEDRTFGNLWSVSWDIARFIAVDAPKSIVSRCVEDGDGFEQNLDLTSTPSGVFVDTVREKLDRREAVSKPALSAYLKSRPIEDVMASQVDYEPSDDEEAELLYAIDLSERIGFPVRRGSVIVKQCLEGGIGVFVSNVVYLSHERWSAKEVCRRILSAGIELMHGDDDDPRKVPQVLMDKVIEMAEIGAAY